MRQRTRSTPSALLRPVFVAVTALLVVALCPPGTAAAADAAFGIGEADGSAAEFALGPGGWQGYAAAFPNDADFTVGTDDPATDLPYIHPGPIDGWAGNKPHTFTLRANLTAAQVESSYLTLHYLDTQASSPPRLDVSVNGTGVGSRQLPRGGGRGHEGTDGTKPSTARVFVPGAALHEGENVFALTHATGSWAVYDQIELVPTGGATPGMTIDSLAPTVLFVQRDGAERQLVDVSVTNDGPATETTFTATQNGKESTTTVTVPPGTSTQRIAVVPTPTGDPVPLTVAADPSGATLTAPLPFQRRWEFHIDHGSHLDIGYTGLQSVVQEQQNEYLDQAITGCENTKDYPEAAKFRWGIESMWVLDNYVRERPQSMLDRLAACIRSGQVEITASYDNNLHDLQTGEQLVRMIYPGAKKYEKRFDTDVVTAFENDSPAVTWQYVQALHKSGVKYLVVGHNATRAPHSPQSNKPGLFWWEAPNGDKVLTWYTSPDANYTEGYGLFPGGNPLGDFGQSVANIDARLRTVQATGFDKDMYLAMFRLDNIPAQLGLSDFAKRFNETYSSPKVVVSTPSRFFGELEKRGDVEDLPVNRGDWSDWWVDGAGSSARETALTRDAQDRTADAETLGALASMTTPTDGRRQSTLDEAYRQAELYTEHTWGASGPTWDDPQWPVKRAYAEDADTLSRQALDGTLTDLSGQVANPGPWPSVAVFNSQSWERDGLVTTEVDEGRLGSRPFRLTDDGHEVPYEIVSRTAGKITLRFVAQDVPAVGYRTLQLVPADSHDRDDRRSRDAVRADEHGMENEYYRLRLDDQTGAIASIVDKRTGRELIDQGSTFKANQFLYRPNDAGTNKWNDKPTSDARQWTPTDATVRVVSRGPVTATLEITHNTGAGGAVTGVRALTERITLTAGVPRVDIANTVDKTRVETAEEAYYAFPFKVDNPDVTYEIPAASVKFYDDQMPGAAMDWQAIGRYADVANSQGGVLFSAPSAPMVEFGHLRTQEFLARPGRLDGQPVQLDPNEYKPKSGAVFSYTHNNLWGTNYRIAQEGPVTFRYAIGSHPAGQDPVRATRFGAEVHSPLRAVGVADHQHGAYEPGSRSLVSVDRSGVTVQTVKRADDGAPGLTVRLLEVAGKDGTTTVRLPFDVGAAQLGDATERPGKSLQVNGSTVRVPVEAHGIVTVLVQPKLSLTARAADPVVARGESTVVTVQLRNDSSRVVRGSVSLTGPDGITVSPASVPVGDLRPGKAVDARFTVSVPADTAPGDVVLTASAKLGTQSALPSKLALSVVNPVDVLATPADLDLVEGAQQPVKVTVTNNLPRPVTATVHMTTPTGWTVGGDGTEVALEPGQSTTVPVTVTAPTGSFGTHKLVLKVGGDATETSIELPASVSRPVAMVGTQDLSTAEFALSPAGYDQYPATFPNGPDLTAGADPKTGWSYIQPGPQDEWAGSRDHKATFRFTLPSTPDRDLTFTAWLLDTNNFNPPYLRATVNGTDGDAIGLPPGGGDGYHWGDGQPNRYGGVRPVTVDVALPASALHAGENVVTISRPSGAWIVYDAFGVRERP